MAIACSAPGQRPAVGSPLPAARAQAETILFAPSGAGAELYNGPPGAQLPRTALGDAIRVGLADIAKRTRTPLPSWDSRLQVASTDLARIVPKQTRLPYKAVEFALQHHGIVEPTPHLLVIWTARNDPARLSAFVAKRLTPILARAPYTRMAAGIAERSGSQMAIVIALLRSFVETDPIPRTLDTGSRVVLHGKLLPPYRAPEVLVARRSGAVEQTTVRLRKGGRFAATVACGRRPGALQVEVSGTGPDGAAVLANFPVYCGEPPPLRVEVALHPGGGSTTVAEAEAILVRQINEERRRAGLPALSVDDEVAEVARRYSDEMAGTGLVAHVSPTSGTADDRLRTAGIVRALVQENLARAATAVEAHESLMNSPGHRANILSPDATHVGVGVHAVGDSGSPDLFITELFTRIPPAINRGLARDEIAEVIHRAHSLRVDEDLGRLAQAHADLLANGVAKDRAAAEAAKRLSAVSGRYGRLRTIILAVSDVRQVAPATLPETRGTTHFGVGVAQGAHAELGDGAIYVVVVFGRRV